ncbi:MAG: LON peptidase substrate-binding domain-containing protein [Anaerolineae bacterium]
MSEILSNTVNYGTITRILKTNERRLSMRKLPLFPLNTVLFPTTPVRLHIFEERYRLMIGQCIAEKQPFGVVALQRGSEVEAGGQHQDLYSVGCTAVITEHQKLHDGRMNIVALGYDRFRILSVDQEQPYLQAVVEDFPLDLTAATAVGFARRLRPWVLRYLRLLGRAENVDIDNQRIPESALELAYVSASLLRVSLSEKQELLAMNTLHSLVSKLYTYYRKEVTLLNLMLATERVREEGPFSLN